jgi:threonyl-tRNA synthetase
VALPINDDLVPFAESVRDQLAAVGLRVEVDDRSESLKKKIREAQLAKTPLILTCGAKEKDSGALSVRTLDGQVHFGIPMETFKDTVLTNVRHRSLEVPKFGE